MTRMRFFVISDNVDTQVGMRLAGIEGVVVHEPEEVNRALTTAMEQEDIAMPMRDTLEPGVKDDLIRIAGKGQVPCLIVDGVPMFESDDIIRFLGDLILEREED